MPEVSVSNNSLFLLKWIQNHAGGIITSKRKKQSHHKDSYAWRIRQNNALHFMEEIKDYLIVKKEQAALILQEYKQVTHRAGKYTPELLKKKSALVEKVRLLNQR